ncbi:MULTISPECIES: outer membrane protein assembly factor BamB family protein [unclassified Streptomyces]|uniref:outer membrane protein assembly factor BamB family protein n=1 Tax=unclassified Streptomyces TaxID=2593676 RepID=UPI002DDBEF1E|nr:PQQ-binding-like beta-propeller repeat protein [Streptomyces sp. NBC_01766]WSC19094.1 PQQ-binding-like beta-propeller repeat protein [Streptomyces sp. NBC_01766]
MPPSRFRSALTAGACAVVLAVVGAPVSSAAPVGGAPSAVSASTLTLVTQQPQVGQKLSFGYTTDAPGATNWIGIYPANRKPGDGAALVWVYVPNATGTVDLDTSGLPAGSYSAWLLANDGYQALAAPVNFDMAPRPARHATVQGTVFDDKNGNGTQGKGEHGLAGVSVSDGAVIVRTDRNGHYTFSADLNQWNHTIVNITMPRGYSAALGSNRVQRFYYDLGSPEDGATVTQNFDLRRDKGSERPDFTFTQITDTHLTSPDGPESPAEGDGVTPGKLAKQLDDMAALPTRPAFVLATGDLSGDGASSHWQAWLKGTANSKLPIWPVTGNHDHGGGDTDGVGNYRSLLGPSWYSFDYGNTHFIQLENNGGLGDPVQMAWLKQDLALNGKNANGSKKQIVVSSHEPLDTPDTGGSAGQIDALLGLLKGYDVKAFFNGHMHTNFTDPHLLDGAVEYNTASATYNDDHSPIGFREIAMRHAELTAEFRMFNQEHTIAATSPAPGSQVGQGRTEFQVDAYHTSSHVVRVEVRVDGQKGQKLGRTGKFSWSAPWDTRRLKPGAHTAAVTAFDDAGRSWSTTSRFTVVPKAEPVRAGADVPEFHGDALHTGVQPGNLGSGNLTNAWTHRSGATIGMSSPVVANGIAYIGTWDTDGAKGNGVDAVDLATGRTKWHFATDSLVQSTPVVHDGTVYLTEMRGTLTAVDAATGAVKWRHALPGSSTTGAYDGYGYGGATVSGSTVYYFGYTTTGSHLVALDTATGKQLWDSPVDSGWWNSSTPTVVGGKVYIHDSRGGLRIYEAATGEQLVSAGGVGGVHHSTPVVADGQVFTTDMSNTLLARDASTGKELWHYQSDGVSKDDAAQPGGSAAVDGHTVYAGFTNGRVAAFDTSTGTKLWEFQSGRAFVGSPTISGGTLWIGGTDGHLYGLDKATGAKLQDLNVGAPILSTPTVTGNTLLTGAWDGNLYAFTARG